MLGLGRREPRDPWLRSGCKSPASLLPIEVAYLGIFSLWACFRGGVCHFVLCLPLAWPAMCACLEASLLAGLRGRKGLRRGSVACSQAPCRPCSARPPPQSLCRLSSQWMTRASGSRAAAPQPSLNHRSSVRGGSAVSAPWHHSSAATPLPNARPQPAPARIQAIAAVVASTIERGWLRASPLWSLPKP